MRRRRHCGCPRPCGCHKPVKEVVHPVKENVVHCCTEETVKHIHPSHTTVVNHHLVKNEHVFPHSTSVANTFDEVDLYPPMGPGPGSVAGAMSPPPGYGPGMGPGYGPGMVKGAHMGHHHHPHHHVAGAHHHHHKPKKWC